jgi:hypothetical protein
VRDKALALIAELLEKEENGTITIAELLILEWILEP